MSVGFFRRVLRYCFVYLAKFDWNPEHVSTFCDLVEKKVVSANTLAKPKKLKKKKKKYQDELPEQKVEVRLLLLVPC